jgi:hypothetical protein
VYILSEIEVPKSILIIKSAPNTLFNVENFLKNRGWKVHASHDLKKSLQLLITQKPSFVMIAIDHPNKKIKALPKLIASSLEAYIIGYTESSSSTAYKALLDSGIKYRINPPVTGPSVERIVHKIFKDLEAKPEREKSERGFVKSSAINIKGGFGSVNDIAYSGGQDQAAGGGFVVDQALAGLLNQLDQESDEGKESIVNQQGVSDQEALPSYSEVDEQNTESYRQSNKPQSVEYGKSEENKDSEIIGGLKRYSDIEKSSGWHKEENTLVKGAQQAIEESVRISDGEVKEKVQDSSNVCCMIIESEKFSGYLVAALGKNKKIDSQFMALINMRLVKFLKSGGENLADEAALNLSIKTVEFEDWAVEYADFLRRSVHNGEEIAMAFFPKEKAKVEITASATQDMGAVKIDELYGDQVVDFNVYIYLPTNKKYVLYTPRGSVFYNNQKGRLTNMGVGHVHVKKTELQDVSRYKAQSYLNAKISEYEAKKNLTPPVAS